MEVRRVLVIGAGTMGHGIAHVAAQSGYDVALFDAMEGAAASGVEKVRKNLEKAVEKGKVTAADRDAALGRISVATDLAAAAAACQLAVEAVPEQVELKQAIFAELGRSAPRDAVLASNTSSLSIAEIAAASGRPARVVGMHFFNPVHLKPLLEVVRTDATDAAALAVAVDVGRRMGKHVIVVKDSPGFATSRLGIALGLEAMRMVEEGVASPEDIDAAMEKGYGHAMGPLRTSDLVGLDVRLGIAEHLDRCFPGGRFTPPALLRRMVEDRRLGQKSGRGFYEWKGA
jgi:3-hydroxybutyryl-CoA dehydrogenase